jgi:hypothetical protein|nr:MAG TPA_asm: hypothetical protein [Caudoviricetes sp.]
MFDIDEKGTITLVQGDSGDINITNLPTDKNLHVSFGVQDEDRRQIGDEVEVIANYSDKVKITLTGGYTNFWTVPEGDDFATYKYGIKLWTEDGAYEDTSIINTSYKGDIKVYPKIVEGYNE